jgi:hypothetical protein
MAIIHQIRWRRVDFTSKVVAVFQRRSGVRPKPRLKAVVFFTKAMSRVSGERFFRR